MKLKLDENGNAVLQDGHPVYIHDDGTEAAFDAAATVATIGRLNGEAKSHREKWQSAQEKLKAFEGIDDPSKALEALKTVRNLDDKKLVDAGEIEKVRQEAIKAKDQEVQEWRTKYDETVSNFRKKSVESAFGNSEFIQTRINTEMYPPEVVRKLYADRVNFDDNGEMYLTDDNGQEIYSVKNPGNKAGFDEGLEMLIGKSHYKDHMLKAPQSTGAGAGKPANNGGSGQKTMKRADFETKPPQEQAGFVKEGGQVID